MAPAPWVLFGLRALRPGLAEGRGGEGLLQKVQFCRAADADGAAPGNAGTA